MSSGAILFFLMYVRRDDIIFLGQVVILDYIFEFFKNMSYDVI